MLKATAFVILGKQLYSLGKQNGKLIIDIHKDIQMNSNRIYFLDEPVYSSEPATKNYVD